MRRGFSVGLACAASTAIVFVGAVALAGCAQLEPETGERVLACSNADSNPAVAVSFARDIRPIMNGTSGSAKPCKNCHYHSTGTQEGLLETGLDLETLGTLRRGSRDGTLVVVPGTPCDSLIVKKLRGTGENARMPKGGPFLTAEQTQLVIDWIAEGARGDDTE